MIIIVRERGRGGGWRERVERKRVVGEVVKISRGDLNSEKRDILEDE